MRNKKLLIVPIALGAIVFGVALSNAAKGSDSFTKKYSSTSQTLESEYDFSESVTIPEYNFVVGENSVSAKGVVVFPEGQSTSEETVTLNQYGVYKVKYSKQYNGKELYHEESFVVRKNIVTLSSNENSRVYYDEIPEYAAPYTSAKGVYIELAKGDTATVESVIDVAAIRKGVNIFSAFVTPKEEEYYDFGTLNFTLTDFENPDIYLRFTNNAYIDIDSLWPGIAWWKVGGNQQAQCGEETPGKIHRGTIFGAKVTVPYNNKRYTTQGNFKLVDPSTMPMYASLDMTDMTTYGNDVFIADLDSGEYFTRLWTGFPSGKCKLTISADTYKDVAARFCLTSVLGVDLTQKKISDKTAPNITVDTDYTLMPEGVIGSSYKVPLANAVDLDSGFAQLDTTIYYNYNSASPVTVAKNVETFTPTKNGYYTIVYSARDLFNNIATRELWVHVGNEIDEITGQVPSSLKDSYKVGEIIDIPALENLNGGSGKLKVELSVNKGSEFYTPIKGKFQPLSTGEYTFRYIVSDYLGNTIVLGKIVNITDNDKPVLAGVDDLPESYMSGKEYDIPEVYAYTFDGGVAQRVLCEAVVTDSKGTNTYTSKFTPVVNENNSNINFKFTCRGEEIYSSSSSVIIPYVDGKLVIDNYFLGDGYSMSKGNSGIVMTLTSPVTNWRFFSKVITNNFALRIGNYENQSNYNTIKVTVTDSKDSTKSISIFLDISGEPVLTVGRKTFGFELDSSSDAFIDYGFNGNVFVINNVEYDVNYFDDGSKFTGFESDFAFCSVQVTGHVGDAYVVKQLNKNVFSAATSDRNDPEFYIVGAYGGRLTQGSKYYLNKVIYNDLISPTVTCTLSVKDPSDQFLTSDEGVLIKGIDPTSYDLSFTLNEIGAYTVSYTVDDKSEFSSRSNPKTWTYKVNSADYIAPEIEVTSDWTREAKVGDTIVMPNFRVTDNNCSIDQITVIKSVVTPLGEEILLKGNSNSIVAKHVGTYTFKVTAIDADGNSSFMTFECVVK